MTSQAYSPLIACTRMYNAAPSVMEAWRVLTEAASRISGVPLETIAHPYPNDIEDLWNRPDIGLVFMCGRAFMLAGAKHIPIAVPLRTGQGGGPFYHSELLVREESPYHCLEDSFGHRLGWTVHHSHSGFIAIREHLASYARKNTAEHFSSLYAEEVGPLHTPARCIAALREKEADVVPLDAYYAELLRRNMPDALQGIRSIDVTRSYPMPLLVAAPTVPLGTCDALRQGLFEACDSPECRKALDALCISGFGEPDIALYETLINAEKTNAPCNNTAKIPQSVKQSERSVA